MTIAICGSLTFARQLRAIQKALEKLGHIGLLPKSIALIEEHRFKKPTTVAERLAAEATHDFIREHFRKVEESDAVLVANYDKNGIKGYIGGNTLLEMGVAFYLGKPMYLLHPVPEMEYCMLEIHAMRPIVLDGDLSKIPQ